MAIKKSMRRIAAIENASRHPYIEYRWHRKQWGDEEGRCGLHTAMVFMVSKTSEKCKKSSGGSYYG